MIALDPASGDKLLQMRIDGNLAGEPMSLNTVPYAMYAERALNIIEDISLDQLPSVIATDEEVNTLIQGEVTNRSNGDSSLQSQVNTVNLSISGLQSQIDGKVSKGGDTINGNLTVNGDIGVTGMVDGVDVGETLKNINNISGILDESKIDLDIARINQLTNNLSDLSGQISTDQAPQFMRPAAFGTIVMGGCGIGGLGAITSYNISSFSNGYNSTVTT